MILALLWSSSLMLLEPQPCDDASLSRTNGLIDNGSMTKIDGLAGGDFMIRIVSHTNEPLLIVASIQPQNKP